MLSGSPTRQTNSIGRITTEGVVTNFTDPTISDPRDITVGPDSALWFTNPDNDSIGRITTDGSVTNFTDPSIDLPTEITNGPDDALWFVNAGNNSIGRITPDGSVTNFSGSGISYPEAITTGPDGALWFINGGANSIGRITTEGVVTDFTDAGISSPTEITPGPDGALWFTNLGYNTIGRITTDGSVTNFTDPSIDDPDYITMGPDNALWFDNGGVDTIGRIEAGSAALTPQTITFTSTPPVSPVVGGSYVVSATGGGSGNPVTFSIGASSQSGACSISDAIVSFTGIGSCVLDADQAGDASFTAAPEQTQTFSIQEAPPTCPGTASGCQSEVGSDPNGSLEVNSGGPNGATATASGAGALTIGQYSSDPVATAAIGATGEYFDVAVSSDNQFSSLAITDCDLSGGNVLEWWNPAGGTGTGAWQAVSTQTFVPGTPNCADATVDASTSPSLSQLVGTIFAVVSVTSAPQVTSAATTTFSVGSSATFSVTTSGFPLPALTLTGTLPSGLRFLDNGNGTATLSGTAATGTAKTYTLKITAKSTAGSSTQTFTLVLNQAPAITSAANATFVTGKFGTFKVTTTGTPVSALSYAGTLPTGVSFVDNGNGTATLSGTPAGGTSASYPFSVTATNAAGFITQNFTLVVNAVPAIISAPTTTFSTGSAGSFTVTTSGSPPPALTYTGTLPSGLSFADNGDGTATLSGTAAVGTAKTYTLKITAKNTAGSSTQTFTLVLNQAPAITSAANATFVTGKSAPSRWPRPARPLSALSYGGTLPAGVSFVDNGNGTATLVGHRRWRHERHAIRSRSPPPTRPGPAPRTSPWWSSRFRQ